MTSIDLKRMSAIKRYIDAIRNDNKRKYAAAYFNYRRGFSHAPEYDNLSTMAAQAVRMRIDEIMGQ